MQTLMPLNNTGAKTEMNNAGNANIDALILTTETGADLKIIKRIEIVTAECAFGMNVFKDMFTNIRDFVGGRSRPCKKP